MFVLILCEYWVYVFENIFEVLCFIVLSKIFFFIWIVVILLLKGEIFKRLVFLMLFDWVFWCKLLLLINLIILLVLNWIFFLLILGLFLIKL